MALFGNAGSLLGGLLGQGGGMLRGGFAPRPMTPTMGHQLGGMFGGTANAVIAALGPNARVFGGARPAPTWGSIGRAPRSPWGV